MKATIKGFLVCKCYSFLDKPQFDFWSVDPKGEIDLITIKPIEIEVDVPDDFDPRIHQIGALEKSKQKLRSAFAAKVTEIDARINKLMALEMAP